MTGKTHQVIGLSAGLTAFFITSSPQYSPATFGALLVGSHLMALLPDIDTASGDIWKSIPFGKTISKVADPFLAHRNLTHSILGVVLVYYGLKYLLQLTPGYWGINTEILIIPLMLAYLSHLVCDFITVQGIPLVFPYGKMMGFPPKPFEGIRIISGKWFENLVIFPIVNLYLIYIIFINFSNIRQFLFK